MVGFGEGEQPVMLMLVFAAHGRSPPAWM
jgi:hypothetical protein